MNKNMISKMGREKVSPWIWRGIILFLMTEFAVNANMTQPTPTHYEEALNICDHKSIQFMYCTCDITDQNKTEVIDCLVQKYEDADQGSNLFWGSFSNFSRIKTWTIKNRRMRFIKNLPPLEVFKKSHKLTTFEISNSEIREIPSYAFANSSSLVVVKLYDNSIEKLHTTAFANMSNLDKIFLDENNLTEINRDTFIGLPKLTSLYLSKNRIQIVHDNAFLYLRNLKYLDLKNNKLTEIVPDIFGGLNKLEELDLRYNKIELLGDHVFAELKNIQTLDLGNNEIMSISPTAFSGLFKLTDLYLINNKIVEILPNSFKDLIKLNFLNLRSNELETLSEELMNPIYPNLKKSSMNVDIAENRFKCDCKILWIQKIYPEIESVTLQSQFNKMECNLFKSRYEDKWRRGGEISLSGDRSIVTVVDLPSPEETTTYAFDSIQKVLDLNPNDFNCNPPPHKKHQIINNHHQQQVQQIQQEKVENNNSYHPHLSDSANETGDDIHHLQHEKSHEKEKERPQKSQQTYSEDRKNVAGDNSILSPSSSSNMIISLPSWQFLIFFIVQFMFRF